MIIVLLGMLIYAVLHSFMAGSHLKDLIRNQFGERVYHGLYRIGYNFIAGVTLLPILFWVYRGSQTVIWSLPDGWLPVTLLLQAIGLIGLGFSLLQIDLGRFAGLSQLRAYLTGESLPLPPEPLQTGGVYALVRHPLYLFSLLVLWPVPQMTDTLLAFTILATLYFVFGSWLEERRMVERFGSVYVAYQQRVAWLIPLLRFRR
jgi:methanethiol S-methyltransferase